MKPATARPILVTSALPYANGPIHLGHLVEHIQTDIWVRFQRMQGREVYSFCADDTHGTPVMLAARAQGISPEELVARVQKEHQRDFAAFGIEFSNYYTTNSPENQELANGIYLAAKEKGHIARRNVRQLYCEHDRMFLPDRFVRGTCPKCGATDQYGDSCDVCGSTYRPEDLTSPRCSVCGNPPVSREEAHVFFKLGDFQNYLQKWMEGRVDEGIRRKMQEWMEQGLREWDISRDGPYFGFEIPGEKNKYFYVWLDAPIGYMASSKNYFQSIGRPELFDRFWRSEDSEVYHFIGKDIVYFHTLFWPATLHVGGFRAPSGVFVHGFLTVNGEKMSKSRGTFIRAESYLKHLDPQALRYFFASRLGAGLDDLDLSPTDFMQKYNSAVVGNFANLFSRLCTKIADELDRTLNASPTPEGVVLCAELLAKKDEILDAYSARNSAKAIRLIEALGDAVNRYVAAREPWKLIKTDREATRAVLTDALNAGWILSYYLRPVLPVFSDGVAELLDLPATFSGTFDDLAANVKDQKWLPGGAGAAGGHRLRPYRHLAARITEEEVNGMFEEEKSAQAKQAEAKAAARPTTKSAAAPTAKDTGSGAALSGSASSGSASGLISIDDLGRVDLRVGRIVSADFVEGADKLLQIVLDVGEEQPRNVFAGIRVAYAPADLVGLLVVCVANLQPRKMKFGISEAMLLAAGEGASLTLFTPQRGAKPGDRLK